CAEDQLDGLVGHDPLLGTLSSLLDCSPIIRKPENDASQEKSVCLTPLTVLISSTPRCREGEPPPEPCARRDAHRRPEYHRERTDQRFCPKKEHLLCTCDAGGPSPCWPAACWRRPCRPRTISGPKQRPPPLWSAKTLTSPSTRPCAR